MKYQFRKLNFWIVLGVDLLLLAAAHLLAYMIRFDGVVPQEQRANIASVLGFLLPVKLALFHLFGLYRGMWRGRYFVVEPFSGVFKIGLCARCCVDLSLYRRVSPQSQAFLSECFLLAFFAGRSRQTASSKAFARHRRRRRSRKADPGNQR